MGNLAHKLHAPGVMIIRAVGVMVGDDLEDWRDELVKFIKENQKRGACGVLIDACEVKGFSIDALDTLAEVLADPEETIHDIRMRFAFIGVKPFAQRFLREAMPLEEVKHIRARFFHEVSEDEALAWLQAMVTSADGLPDVKSTTDKQESTASKQAVTKKTDAQRNKSTKEADIKPTKLEAKSVVTILKGANLNKSDDRKTEEKSLSKVDGKKPTE